MAPARLRPADKPSEAETEETSMLWLFVVLLMLAADAAVAYAANERGRDPAVWFGIALVISPLLAILVLMAMGEERTQAPLRSEPEWKPTTTNWSIHNRPTRPNAPHDWNVEQPARPNDWNLNEIRELGEKGTTERLDKAFERMYGAEARKRAPTLYELEARVAKLEEQLRKLTAANQPEPEHEANADPEPTCEPEPSDLTSRKPVLGGYWHVKGGAA
jgi:hypothetical protein